MELNKYIDHTNLKPDATALEIEKLCNEAKKYNFATVCVNPSRVEEVKKHLLGSEVKITTVIGFPLGASTSDAKVNETLDAFKKGADEIDMVINIGAVKDHNWDLVLSDLKAMRDASKNHILKVILETCLLTEEEIIKSCELAVQANLDFVKTSTGFSTSGATVENVALMSKTVNGKAKVKAAGGVRSREDFMKMIEAGAERVGTSGGVKIMENQEHNSGY